MPSIFAEYGKICAEYIMKPGGTLPKSAKSRRRHVYSNKEYNSNDGMLTTVWGPGMWHFQHTMSFNYPVRPTPTQKKDYRNHVLGLRKVLPCGKCRTNLTRTMKKMPLTMKHMKSRATFSRYMYCLHEAVNKMLHKKSQLTYDDVRERYEHFRARCNPLAKITRKRKPEAGCTEPLFGEKSKCVLKIVPTTTKCETMQIDKKCIKQKLI